MARKGKKVCWKYGKGRYCGTLIPSMEDEKNRYERTENGKIKNLDCDGLLSTCLQHEINHLDGKLIIDHLSKLKRDMIIKKISKNKENPDRILV